MSFLTEVIAALSSVVIALTIVLSVVLFGWFIIWKMFLVKFPLIKELVNGYGANSEKRTADDSSVRPRRTVRLRQGRLSNENDAMLD